MRNTIVAILTLSVIVSCKPKENVVSGISKQKVVQNLRNYPIYPKLSGNASHDDKKAWFHNAKVGIFIHWNISSVKHQYDTTKHPSSDVNSPWKIPGFTPPESTDKEEYSTAKGVDISWGRIGPRRGKFDKFDDVTPLSDEYAVSPFAQYNLLYKSFKPTQLNPEKWAKLFKKAGANYVVQIAKHHDGFAMFDADQSLIMDDKGYPKVDQNGDAVIAKDETKNQGWKITNADSYGKDILKLSSDAFRKEGLQIGFYYSNPDWTHPNYQVTKSEKLNLKDKTHP